MQTLDLKLFEFGIEVSRCAAIGRIEERREALREAVDLVRMKICGECQEPFTYQTYLSWWQQFKAEVFPKWLLKKYPAKTQTHTVDVKVLYPFLKAKLPKDLRGDRFTVVVNNHTHAVWSDQPVTMLDMQERLISEKMFDMTQKRCMTCGASYDMIFKR